jgi:hypothetical protein
MGRVEQPLAELGAQLPGEVKLPPGLGPPCPLRMDGSVTPAVITSSCVWKACRVMTR